MWRGVGQLLLTAVVAAALAGCGGGEDDSRGERAPRPPAHPRAREDVRAAARDLVAAVRRDDCDRLGRRFGGLPARLVARECRWLRRAGVLERLEGWDGSVRRHGTGAIGRTRVYTEIQHVVLALGRDGRWHLRGVAVSYFGPTPTELDLRRVVDHGLDALRRDECEALGIVFTYAEDRVCERTDVRTLRRAMRTRRRLPVRYLGGNDSVTFVGVGPPSGPFFTVTLVPVDGTWRWFDVLRSDPAPR